MKYIGKNLYCREKLTNYLEIRLCEIPLSRKIHPLRHKGKQNFTVTIEIYFSKENDKAYMVIQFYFPLNTLYKYVHPIVYKSSKYVAYVVHFHIFHFLLSLINKDIVNMYTSILEPCLGEFIISSNRWKYHYMRAITSLPTW